MRMEERHHPEFYNSCRIPDTGDSGIFSVSMVSENEN